MMDDGEEVGTVSAVGDRLKAAREAKKMSLDDLATQTRIPTRHLESLENGDFTRLPAPTYTIGFAKNYAAAVGLSQSEIASDLRAELGGTRPQTFEVETYEPADPARAMPKGLIVAALAGILLLVLGLTWLNNRSLSGPDEAVVNEAASNATAAAPPPVAAAPVVALTASQPVWVDIRDGLVVLKQGELAVGERYVVPDTAQTPLLSTAKPEALTITVGDRTAPSIGPAGRKVSDVSLKGADLLKPPANASPVTTVTTPVAPPPARTAPRRTTTSRPAPPPVDAPDPQPAPPPAATANSAAPGQ